MKLRAMRENNDVNVPDFASLHAGYGREKSSASTKLLRAYFISSAPLVAF